jgi:hypothetical protein
MKTYRRKKSSRKKPSKLQRAKYVPPYDRREQHLPGYNFCGPGTNVTRRLRSGVKPVNKLDAAALEHDIAVEPRGPYTAKGHGPALRAADRRLMEAAQRLMFVKGENRWACMAVMSAMEGLLATGARGRGLKD